MTDRELYERVKAARVELYVLSVEAKRRRREQAAAPPHAARREEG